MSDLRPIRPKATNPAVDLFKAFNPYKKWKYGIWRCNFCFAMQISRPCELRLIDTEVPDSCPKGYTPVQWERVK